MQAFLIFCFNICRWHKGWVCGTRAVAPWVQPSVTSKVGQEGFVADLYRSVGVAHDCQSLCACGLRGNGLADLSGSGCFISQGLWCTSR